MGEVNQQTYNKTTGKAIINGRSESTIFFLNNWQSNYQWEK
jgi:hypothetical protein